MRSSGRTVTEVAREIGVGSESLRGWVKKASAAQDTGSVPAATSRPSSRPTSPADPVSPRKPFSTSTVAPTG
ncbi:transposase [Streptomyces sp. B21-105]|uniref:transposase n=1 Tax=Streptomyces sp. B21-105 TaxID=3039417 RepID=UPI003FA69B2A